VKNHPDVPCRGAVRKNMGRFSISINIGAPGLARRFQRVQFPPRKGEEAPHRESSLGPMKAMTGVKHRQSYAEFGSQGPALMNKLRLPAAFPKCYSVLRASAGFTAAARRAGIPVCTNWGRFTAFSILSWPRTIHL
jgi:hypothetical protein